MLRQCTHAVQELSTEYKANELSTGYNAMSIGCALRKARVRPVSNLVSPCEQPIYFNDSCIFPTCSRCALSKVRVRPVSTMSSTSTTCLPLVVLKSRSTFKPGCKCVRVCVCARVRMRAHRRVVAQALLITLRR
eukprot:1140920-Pelagomonas_calceolata.AAC.2